MAENESLYDGSSIFPGGARVDDVDLPEYLRLCRRLFPTVVDNDSNPLEPEAEESIARYLKYLTGLPLSSLRMEPTLLEGDLQRISNELSILLANEALSQASVKNVFESVYDTTQASSKTSSQLNGSLSKVKDVLGRLEQSCGQFATQMKGMEQRSKVMQRVLDKQDLINRIIELPRVMQMCVAGGYYEQAVEIAEHVRVTGNRLVRDVKDEMRSLPGAHGIGPTKETRQQLLHFVGSVQRQVQTEFENMILNLCRELSSARSVSVGVSLQLQRTSSELGSNITPQHKGDNSSDRDMARSLKRLSQMANTVAILRGVGIFTENELRMLFLRSRWQAWLQIVESLSGLAPTFLNMSQKPSDPATSPSHSSPPLQANSSELAAYLAKYIESFFAWLTEVSMQYQTLFTTTSTTNSDGSDSFADLAIYSSQHFVSDVLPLVDMLSEASGISNLESIVATHASTLATHDIDFAVSHLQQSLRERAFVSVVSGVELTTQKVCQELQRLVDLSQWGSLAVPTRPLLDLPDSFSNDCRSNDASAFLSQFRISPVGLLQYPLLSQLLHAFREALHALRIFVLAGDSGITQVPADGNDGGHVDETLVLLNMTSTVFESELLQTTDALVKVCEKVFGSPDSNERATQAVKDTCVAFVFGVVRNVAEIFEEVTTLSESATAREGDEENSLLATLYSQEIYNSLRW